VRYNWGGGAGASLLVGPLWMTIIVLDAQRHRPIGDQIPARISHLAFHLSLSAIVKLNILSMIHVPHVLFRRA
jgi:hypothetical protein